MTTARGRILWVVSNCPRWAGDASAPFILNLARDLRDRDWDVTLLAPAAAGLPSRDVIEGVPVERFAYAWPASLQTLCYGAGVFAHLRERRARAALIPGYVASQWLALRRRLGATPGFDLLHAHWVLPQGFTAALAAPPRTPLLVTAHGGDLFALRGGISERAKCWVLQRAAAVSVNSSATEAVARRLGAPAERLVRIPMGATLAAAPDAARVAALRAQLRRGAGPLLLFVGRVVPEKGVGDALAALALLRADLPDATLAIVGDGPARAEFEAQALRLRVADRAAFIGAVPPADVPLYLAAADVFVGPSRRSAEGWIEAQGLSFIEAQLAGLPVIATDAGGLGDFVTDGDTGLVVPQADPAAVADAVRRLLADPALATRLAAAGRAHALAHGSRAASADAFSALYARLLADAAAARSKK
jgi:glycosyltransferase involved in cell wall biosynthesis